MKTDVDHLPELQQAELQRAQHVLMSEFAESVSRATTPSRRDGKIFKIILFGSYARDDWVDEPANGYQSDFDLLVIVSHDDLTEIAHYWYIAEDRILRDGAITRQVNIIVHSLDEVNQALKRGDYFWVDIARDGIVLYELPCHPLATPMPLTPADAYSMARGYFDEWLPSSDRAITTAERQFQTEEDDRGWRKDAAFSLHDLAISVLERQMGKQCEHVFTYAGRPIGQVNTRHWRAALERAGITAFRWHDLRHTWASWLRQNDVPTWVLQELGGWKSETMVRRYAHMSVKHLQPYADQLIFEGKSGHTAPEREKPGQGHKNGHSESPFRLKLVAGTDLAFEM